MRTHVTLAAFIILGSTCRSNADTPTTVDTTPTTQQATERNWLDPEHALPKETGQNVDSQLEQAKRELDELQSKSEQLKLRIQELEENRSKIAEIKRLLSQLPDEGWDDINSWLQDQLRNRHLMEQLDLPSGRFEKATIFPLEIELRVLTDRYGKEHPAVRTMQKRLELSKQQLKTILDQERKLNQPNEL